METSKPLTVPVKDFLIRRMMIETAISEEVITAVIEHQFTAFVEASKSNSSMELSGFGRFIFYEKKAVRKLESYNVIMGKLLAILDDSGTTEKKRMNTEHLVEDLTEKIKRLKDKLYGTQLGTHI